MDLKGVISVPFEVPLNNRLYPLGLKIGPGKAAWIEEHFSNIAGKDIPVPDAKVMELVPAQEQPFETQGCEQVINSSNPLGHARVVSVFRLERELKKVLVGKRWEAPTISV